MKQTHFAGLNGLRFIAITFVVLHHLFTFKGNYGFTSLTAPVLGLIGLYGIHFFFTGSGFLITYLLLSELKHFGKISLKDFFLRRMLRIWPAYYLLIIIALLFTLKDHFFFIPGITDAYLSRDYQKSNLLYFSFLPHIQPFLYPTGPYVHQTYTIGLEEQFYVLWGIMFYFFPRRAYRIILVIILSSPFLNFCHERLFEYLNGSNKETYSILIYLKKALFYLKYSKISTFSIGAFFGFAFFEKHRWTYYFKLRSVQLCLYMILMFSIYNNLEIRYAHHEYMALLMASIMLIATFKEESIINYDSKWIDYLGKISYGVYLFHIFAIVIVVKVLNDAFKITFSNFWQTFLLCILTLLLSIFFGWISYHFFETFFLKLKRRFSRSVNPLG